MKKIIIIGIVTFILAVILFLFLWYQDNTLTVSKYKYQSTKIPKDFNDYKMLQISDLHDKSFGKNQKRLMRIVDEENPDIIVVTGDIVNRDDYKNSLKLIRLMSEKSKVYFVPGNHEARNENYKEIRESIAVHVTVLENDIVQINKGESFINIAGLADPDFYTKTNPGIHRDWIGRKLKGLELTENQFNILLSHRPDLFDVYQQYNVDLVFSGHAHGGQFILPYIGSVYAPDQGFRPKYTMGVHEGNGTTMVVSRGLGNMVKIPRLFNRPEVVVVTIHND